jgi:hypothetical protein
MAMGNTPKLKRVHRLDSIPLDATYFTEEGYLVDEPVVTSVGIFEYKNPGGGIRRELRLPEHVFDPASLETYEGKPVIITHDAGYVDKKNVEREIVGTMLSKGYKDGDDVRARIIIHGIDAVKRSGLRELSLGYDLQLDETPGEWNGQPYDAIQTEIKINHLALVGDARAGDQARLNLDGNNNQTLKGAKNMAKKSAMGSEELKKTIAAYTARRKQRLDEAERDDEGKNTDTVNNDTEGLTGVPPADANPQSATAEERVQLVKDRRDRRDQEGDPKTPEEMLGVIAQQDEDIGDLFEIVEELMAKTDYDAACKDGEKSDAENEDEDKEDEDETGGGGVTLKIQTDAMDAIVRERLKLGRIGDSLNLDGLEDMKPLDAKKAVVKKVNPTMRLDGKSKTYINAAFDAAVASLSSTGGGKDCNYQRKQMSNRTDSRTDFTPTGKTAASRARERMIERQQNGGNE